MRWGRQPLIRPILVPLVRQPLKDEPSKGGLAHTAERERRKCTPITKKGFSTSMCAELAELTKEELDHLRLFNRRAQDARTKKAQEKPESLGSFIGSMGFAEQLKQRATCGLYRAVFVPSPDHLIAGVALEGFGAKPPLNGERSNPVAGTSGWFLWTGEDLSPETKFDAICVAHLRDLAPLSVRFLGLAPGWRFLTDGRYTDVWFDPKLLDDD